MMTFEEAKRDSNYEFVCDTLELYLDEIRRNEFKYHDEIDGEHICGVAKLEIGCIDIEVNLENENYDINDRPMNDVAVEYFICAKGRCDNGKEAWTSLGYLDNYKVDVNFHRDDWKEQLERDMFQKLNTIVKLFNLKYDEYNFMSDEEEQELFDMFGRCAA